MFFWMCQFHSLGWLLTIFFKNWFFLVRPILAIKDFQLSNFLVIKLNNQQFSVVNFQSPNWATKFFKSFPKHFLGAIRKLFSKDLMTTKEINHYLWNSITAWKYLIIKSSNWNFLVVTWKFFLVTIVKISIIWWWKMKKISC
jgi:hypothetical protein